MAGNPFAIRHSPFATLAIAACLLATPAAAHGFGQRYELPVPLSLYLVGAAAAVALSFVVFGLFVRRAHARLARSRYALSAAAVRRTIGHPAVLAAVRAGALGLFLVTVLAGLVGNQNPYRNLAPTLVWVVWWVGFAYVQAFLGDVWGLINPWRTAWDAADWLWRRLGRGRQLSLGLPYPPKLGAWPACLLLLAFAWIELVSPSAASPAYIAWLAIAYSILTWAGMLLFGRDAWLGNGEVFSLVFGTLARFAPTEARGGGLALRPFGAGLLQAAPVSTSMMAFVLLLLATVLYDGLIGTGEWALLEEALLPMLGGPGGASSMALKSGGLLVLWLLFLAAYLGVCAAMGAFAGGHPGTMDIARSFALTLVPIAIGYHVAHYLVFLLVQGQYLIPLLSDPFGWGWNLLGTAGYRLDIGLVDARFAWYLAVGAIVIGHVTAVYLAHVRAIGLFDVPGAALRSQVPLTALMVVYTFFGLSIAAQPIVESRSTPAAVASEATGLPPGAVLPSAQDGRLAEPGSDRTARVKLVYKVLGSAYHDGTRTSVADLLYAYAFAYRWGVRDGPDDPHYDPVIAAATAHLRRHLVAVRAAGADAASRSFLVGDVKFVRELFTFEVYLDIAPAEADWNAVVAPPWSTVPWHVLALMEEAVGRGWAAFSEAEAKRRGVPWLDLVRSQELNARLAALVADFEREAFRPEALRAHVGDEEARRRWRALAAFHAASGHFLVTNGPYKLKAWSANGVTLEAFRDLSYPLGVGSYDAYAVPRRGFVTKVETDGARVTLFADIEVVEKFQRSHRLVRTPLKSIPAVLLQRAAPECRWTIADGEGRIALAGTARPGPDGSFQIDLKDRLPPGSYTLSALIAVNGNTMNAEIHRTPLSVPARR